VRRRGPRGLASALHAELPRLRPATTLARVQEVWPGVAGPALSDEATPVAERAGTVTLSCKSAVWAQEPELLAGDLLPLLNRALGSDASGSPVARLRFVASARSGPARRV
jgi:predicted nucleic acid-binding Zn ribbon protein